MSGHDFSPAGANPEAARVFAPEPSCAPPSEAPLFANYEQYLPAPQRIPNFGHLIVFVMLAIGGYLCSGLFLLGALYFHLYGVTTIKQAMNEIHYTLGSQAIWYVATLIACVAIFPVTWHRSFFDGVHWEAAEAWLRRRSLFKAAVLCFVLALVDGLLIPGPKDTPIDQIFRMPGAAWLLFGFGITLAPLFEEIAYRGFILPTLCTAWDWTAERITGTAAMPPDPDGNPRWSIPAMAAASLLTSIPFALMHAEQTAYSIGPFLLLVCVSLILCWIRLSARSLCASVLVHSCYNFLLFSLMLFGTGGFRHLDKM